MAGLPNVSQDLVWELVRKQNSFLVKRKTNGGVQFSRDPFNLTNKHSRTHAGFVNDKAISVTPNEKGGVQITSKKAKSKHQPAAAHHNVTHGGHKSARRSYKSVANLSSRNNYRPDLRQAAVARVSAIRKSQRTPKPTPEKKLRGNAAKKAAAEEK